MNEQMQLSDRTIERFARLPTPLRDHTLIDWSEATEGQIALTYFHTKNQWVTWRVTDADQFVQPRYHIDFQVAVEDYETRGVMNMNRFTTPHQSGDVVLIYNVPQFCQQPVGMAILIKLKCLYNRGVLENWEVAMLNEDPPVKTTKLVWFGQERLWWGTTEKSNLYEVKV